jgi:hypothetical protein
LNRKEKGAINAGVLTLMVAGAALAGLLIYGWQSGQELPLWPALAVAAVNVIAALKVVVDVKKSRSQPPSA